MKTGKDLARKPGTNNTKPGAASPPPARKTGTLSATARPVQTGRPQNGVQRRTAVVPAKKSGFRMRPVDMIITSVAVLIIGFIVWAVWTSANDKPAATASDPNDIYASLLKVGTAAPDFTLPANDGKTYSLSQFKGKPILMEFMAPWCPHCQEDSTILNQIYDKYSSKGLVMLAVSATPYGKDYNGTTKPPITMDDMTWFASTFNVKYPMMLDKDVKERDAYGIDYYPTLYVLDKNQTVASRIMADDTSAITADRISAEVDKVLK